MFYWGNFYISVFHSEEIHEFKCDFIKPRSFHSREKIFDTVVRFLMTEEDREIEWRDSVTTISVVIFNTFNRSWWVFEHKGRSDQCIVFWSNNLTKDATNNW